MRAHFNGINEDELGSKGFVKENLRRERAVYWLPVALFTQK